MWELTKSFRFEAAHALMGTTLGAASEEIHGHSFRAEVTLRGTPDPATGRVLDLGLLQRSIEDVANPREPFTICVGAGPARRSDRARQHSSRQLQ